MGNATEPESVRPSVTGVRDSHGKGLLEPRENFNSASREDKDHVVDVVHLEE